MQGLGGILDVAIGMTFLFALLSMICSGINELIAWILSLRAVTLRAGIRALLTDEVLSQRLFQHPLIVGLSPRGWLAKQEPHPSYIPSGSFVTVLFDSLGGQALDAEKLRAAFAKLTTELAAQSVQIPAEVTALLERLPSSGTAAGISVESAQAVRLGLRQFVLSTPDCESRAVILELLDSQESLAGIRRILDSMKPDSALRGQLELLLDNSINAVADYRKRVQTWFDDAMERLTGMYKRRIQIVGVIVGISVAFIGGVDSGVIASFLMHDPVTRKAVADAAKQETEKYFQSLPKDTGSESTAPPITADQNEALQKMTTQLANTAVQVTSLQLPIGYTVLRQGHASPALGNWRGVISFLGYWFLRFLGMLFTGLAISFGAPFWFDLLSKLTNLRTSGPPPAKPAAS